MLLENRTKREWRELFKRVAARQTIWVRNKKTFKWLCSTSVKQSYLSNCCLQWENPQISKARLHTQHTPDFSFFIFKTRLDTVERQAFCISPKKQQSDIKRHQRGLQTHWCKGIYIYLYIQAWKQSLRELMQLDRKARRGARCLVRSWEARSWDRALILSREPRGTAHFYPAQLEPFLSPSWDKTTRTESG